MAAPKTTKGEIEANPAPKYEDVSGPQRVGADTGTAYPITDQAIPPKESVQTDAPDGREQDADVKATEAAEKEAKK